MAQITVLEPIVLPDAPVQAISQISEQEAKEFIYYKESSNRLDAINSGGCVGIGQDCNGQLAIDCPNWQTDYACQDNYFTQYAVARYGSWINAYNFWISGHNWY